uniref:Intraflagellar transport protein 46 homolog n=1 Tax=Macrostomum lignano TaxID=282301 RepID=A0A1I8FN56_9PLAT
MVRRSRVSKAASQWPEVGGRQLRGSLGRVEPQQRQVARQLAARTPSAAGAAGAQKASSVLAHPRQGRVQPAAPGPSRCRPKLSSASPGVRVGPAFIQPAHNADEGGRLVGSSDQHFSSSQRQALRALRRQPGSRSPFLDHPSTPICGRRANGISFAYFANILSRSLLTFAGSLQTPERHLPGVSSSHSSTARPVGHARQSHGFHHRRPVAAQQHSTSGHPGGVPARVTRGAASSTTLAAPKSHSFAETEKSSCCSTTTGSAGPVTDRIWQAGSATEDSGEGLTTETRGICGGWLQLRISAGPGSLGLSPLSNAEDLGRLGPATGIWESVRLTLNWHQDPTEDLGGWPSKLRIWEGSWPSNWRDLARPGPSNCGGSGRLAQQQLAESGRPGPLQTGDLGAALGQLRHRDALIWAACRLAPSQLDDVPVAHLVEQRGFQSGPASSSFFTAPGLFSLFQTLPLEPAPSSFVELQVRVLNLANARHEQLEAGGENLHSNKPYDESIDIPDTEDIATPESAIVQDRVELQTVGSSSSSIISGRRSEDSGSGRSQRMRAAAAAAAASSGPLANGGRRTMDESGSESGEESEEDDTQPIEGAYNPEDYRDFAELFDYIKRYTPAAHRAGPPPQAVHPGLHPGRGRHRRLHQGARAGLEADQLGLRMLDEPCASQSDPTVLDLQAAALSASCWCPRRRRCPGGKTPNGIRTQIEKWISSISGSPGTSTKQPCQRWNYTKPMPDIEQLMSEVCAAPEIEELLKEVGLPTSNLECDLPAFCDIACWTSQSNKSRVAVLCTCCFTLYSTFRQLAALSASSLAEGNSGAGQPAESSSPSKREENSTTYERPGIFDGVSDAPRLSRRALHCAGPASHGLGSLMARDGPPGSVRALARPVLARNRGTAPSPEALRQSSTALPIGQQDGQLLKRFSAIRFGGRDVRQEETRHDEEGRARRRVLVAAPRGRAEAPQARSTRTGSRSASDDERTRKPQRGRGREQADLERDSYCSYSSRHSQPPVTSGQGSATSTAARPTERLRSAERLAARWEPAHRSRPRPRRRRAAEAGDGQAAVEPEPLAVRKAGGGGNGQRLVKEKWAEVCSMGVQRGGSAQRPRALAQKNTDGVHPGRRWPEEQVGGGKVGHVKSVHRGPGDYCLARMLTQGG